MNIESKHHARQHRFAVLGVTAGLLGGGAIGLLATTPSFSSAAGAPNATAAVAAEPTDTSADTSTDTAPSTDPAERPDPSVRLRESLQTLVDDGTITSEQADAVATHLGSMRGDRAGGRHGDGHRAGGANSAALAELLGLEAAEIRTALQAGSTIAELAEANSVDVQTVIDGLVAAANLRIDEAVADGRITDDEAAAKRAELVTRITDSVNTVHPAGDRNG
jgi:polyhydroxyalkanoate synthesis regulator phasin